MFGKLKQLFKRSSSSEHTSKARDSFDSSTGEDFPDSTTSFSHNPSIPSHIQSPNLLHVLSTSGFDDAMIPVFDEKQQREAAADTLGRTLRTGNSRGSVYGLAGLVRSDTMSTGSGAGPNGSRGNLLANGSSSSLASYRPSEGWNDLPPSMLEQSHRRASTPRMSPRPSSQYARHSPHPSGSYSNGQSSPISSASPIPSISSVSMGPPPPVAGYRGPQRGQAVQYQGPTRDPASVNHSHNQNQNYNQGPPPVPQHQMLRGGPVRQTSMASERIREDVGPEERAEQLHRESRVEVEEEKEKEKEKEKDVANVERKEEAEQARPEIYTPSLVTNGSSTPPSSIAEPKVEVMLERPVEMETESSVGSSESAPEMLVKEVVHTKPEEVNVASEETKMAPQARVKELLKAKKAEREAAKRAAETQAA
ncbi:hypothetical protein YB2330_001093 [Saitoella coloradoensis]